MSFPTDWEGREAKWDELMRRTWEAARRNYSSMVCGWNQPRNHEHCKAGPERCLCECQDPKRTEPHEADT
jgi:hypothetical protein